MTIACPDCGALEDIPPLPPRSKAVCRLCRRDLEKTSGRSITAALACALGTLLLLVPANILPLISVQMLGMGTQTSLGAGVAALWSRDWIVVSSLTAILVIAIPFIRFGLLTFVLGALKLGYKPPRLGPAFRWAVWLDPWAMPDVFLLACFVGYYRLINLSGVDVSIQLGGYCFIAAGFLTMLSRAALDRRTVWRALGPEASFQPDEEVVSCTACDLVQPASKEGHPCPRCGAKLLARKPDVIPRTAALVVASFLLFIPANIFPMNVSNQMGEQVGYTIFTGVKDLIGGDRWLLGCIVFCTSIAIPLGKILAMGWCVFSVWRHRRRRLVAKTKIFRLIAELGRWSKTDPFTIVFYVPLIDFGPLASARADWGAMAFMLMTMLTMIASFTFDPRLMWDVATPGSQ